MKLRYALALAYVALTALPLSADATSRPNILFIISDDQERREFNFLPEGRDEDGKPRNLSPNLDRLAAEGVVFLNQYVTSPVCTPSRFTVLTGTYASRSHNFTKTVKENGQVNITWNCHIDRETPNLARTLKQAGYFTGAVGKNHVIEVKGVGRDGGPADDADPKDPNVAAYYANKQRKLVEAFKACGFDFAANLYQGNLPGHTCKALEFHNMDWITSGALRFLDQWKKTDKPFFLYMATTLNHGPGPRYRKYTGDPLATPAGLLKTPLDVQPGRDTIPQRVKQAGLSEQPTACDVLWLDDGIGAVLDRLKSIGALDNTIVFFFDDHGVESGKGSLYEGGIKSVSFVWSPKHIRGGRQSKVNVSNIDFAPTIMELCGVLPRVSVAGFTSRQPAEALHPSGRPAGWTRFGRAGEGFLPELLRQGSALQHHCRPTGKEQPVRGQVAADARARDEAFAAQSSRQSAWLVCGVHRQIAVVRCASQSTHTTQGPSPV